MRLMQWFAGFVLLLVTAVLGTAAQGADHLVETAAISVNGASKRVLTDAKGMTLYYLATDTAGRSTCTGGCAKVWPPLLRMSAPSAKGALPGKLTLVKTENGSQVSYNRHLLYTYSGDTAPHQANGQGIAGKWWVAAVDLKPAMSGTPSKPSSGGYGW